MASTFTLSPESVKNIQAINKVGLDKFNKGWVKFGNDKLNINTTSAIGLEKAIGVVARFMMKIQGNINQILYGKFTSGKEDPNLIKRLLNKGIINLLEGIASVDFCNILNYSLNNLPDGKIFDANNPPASTDVVARKKWELQKKAFDIQQFIDQYYREYVDTNNPQSRIGLLLLIQQINSTLSTVISNTSTGLNDPLIKENFPQISTASNFLQNAFGVFNRYTDLRQASVQEIQKIVSLVDSVRQYAIIIQGLNNPKNAIGLIDSSLNGAIQKELSDISSLILQPEKASSILKSIIKTVNTINNIAQKVLGFINTLQVITKVCILLIKIFNVVSAFFIALPIPNMSTTIGITNKFSDILQNKVKEAGQKKLILRLEQIFAVLNLTAIVVTSLYAAIQNIIDRLKLIQLNLDNCPNKNVDLLNEINDSINDLTKTSVKLGNFLNQYNDQQTKSESQFGKYAIKIVTEQVVDEGINLRRRYGIARDTNGYIVVQSTPTFASLDLIIINEVKALLVSKGLVSSNLSSLSSEDQVTILEAARFLGEDEIGLDNIELSVSDIQTIEEQDSELGISMFINNLPGGRALRKRIRDKMINNASKLGSDLKSTDPGGKFSSGLIQQQESETNKLEIQNLEDSIDGWKKEVALAASQGVSGLVILRDRTQKIKDAEKKIQQLRQG
jgi:FtsZ-binding cell division protein ZapB